MTSLRRIGYVQFFVRTDHDALVLSPGAIRPLIGHGLLGGHAPLPPSSMYPPLHDHKHGLIIKDYGIS